MYAKFECSAINTLEDILEVKVVNIQHRMR